MIFKPLRQKRVDIDDETFETHKMRINYNFFYSFHEFIVIKFFSGEFRGKKSLKFCDLP